jgi:hypothetical protein
MPFSSLLGVRRYTLLPESANLLGIEYWGVGAARVTDSEGVHDTRHTEPTECRESSVWAR